MVSAEAPYRVRTTRISDNSIVGMSDTGAANAIGAGITNLSGNVSLERTIVTANSASALGVGGLNLGGGILNVLFGGAAPSL